MALRLSEGDIRQRLQKLRNYERLYPKLRRDYDELKYKYRVLQEEFAEYRRTSEARIQSLELQIEQLKAIVFGRKRDESGDHEEHGGGAAPPSERQPRPSSSYRRAIPPADAITAHTTFPIDQCPDCGTALTRKGTVNRFIEDIPLPRKTVTEQRIGRGFCPRCRKVRSAIPISPQVCTLGENVRLYVPFAVTVLGQTFEKVKAHLQGVHGLLISDGEITEILHEAHRKLLPARQDIAASIRASPVAHYDETSYPVQGGEQGDYAWVKTRADGPETLFLLGRTRGKGNAEEIRGPPSEQVAVTDDYGAYDHLSPHHQLCWAHPLRKLRDLAQSSVLNPRERQACQRTYVRFKTLFRDVEAFITVEHAVREREAAHRRFAERIGKITIPNASDPPKLRTIKETFRNNTGKYLLSLRIPGVPLTNNKAERSLRHLVIKRLLSFGSRTQKGAQTMETLLSVLLTLWWRKPEDYFGELRTLMAPA